MLFWPHSIAYIVSKWKDVSLCYKSFEWNDRPWPLSRGSILRWVTTQGWGCWAWLTKQWGQCPTCAFLHRFDGRNTHASTRDIWGDSWSDMQQAVIFLDTNKGGIERMSKNLVGLDECFWMLCPVLAQMCPSFPSPARFVTFKCRARWGGSLRNKSVLFTLRWTCPKTRCIRTNLRTSQ